jgi:hypothetical protein
MCSADMFALFAFACSCMPHLPQLFEEHLMSQHNLTNS